MRRTVDTLDLNLESNKDLLENIDKLREILSNNKYIKFILMNERLTDEQKTVLGELVPDISYEYAGSANKVYDRNNQYGEHVDFNGFMEAEKVFDAMVSGIDESWSEVEKFKYLYNAIGEIISYDINVLEKNDDDDSRRRANVVARNPFNNIVKRLGVCAGYAYTYMYACRKAGLSCRTESSGDHRYNIIEYID